MFGFGPPKGEKEKELSSLTASKYSWGIGGAAALVAGAVIAWEVATVAIIPAAVVSLYAGFKSVQKWHERNVLEKELAKEVDTLHAHGASVAKTVNIPTVAPAAAQETPIVAAAPVAAAAAPEASTSEQTSEQWRTMVRDREQQAAVAGGRI